MKAIKTIVILLLALSIVNATQYWVSPFGYDSNDGKSQTTPFKTFNKAVTIAISGDVITALPGLYTGSSNTAITINKRITINSTEGAQQTMVTGPGGWYILQSTSISGIQFTNFATNVFIVDSYNDNTLETFTLDEVIATNNNLVISLKSNYNNINIFNSNFTGNNNTIISNLSQRPGVTEITNSTFTNSGAIVGYYYDVVIQNTIFQHCKCASSGCALSLNQSHSLLINQCSFFDISSLLNGGAIYLSNLNPNNRIFDSYFNDNSAVGNGGAIYSAQLISVYSSIFDSNSAEGNGGAIYSVHSNDIITSIFDSNNAVIGGAVYLKGQSGSAIGSNFVSTEFNKNVAKTSGGAVYCEYNVVSYQYVEFDDNEAPKHPSYQCGAGCSSVLFNVVDDYPSSCTP